MARGRMVSKALSTSQKFARLHDVAGKRAEFCQLLFPLLVAHADDYGRQSGDTFTVKHAVVPTSPRKETDVAFALQCLHDVGLVVWYEVDGRKYLEIVDFDKHQSGLHKRTKEMIPGPSGNFREFPGDSRLREENRTKEKRTEWKGTEEEISSETDSVSEPALLTFSTVGKSPTWALTASRVAEWASLYPSLDVEAECRKALAWVSANPDRRKTAKGMPAFLVNWLNRAADRGGSPAQSAPGLTNPRSKTAGNVAALQSFVDRMSGTR